MNFSYFMSSIVRSSVRDAFSSVLLNFNAIIIFGCGNVRKTAGVMQLCSKKITINQEDKIYFLLAMMVKHLAVSARYMH